MASDTRERSLRWNPSAHSQGSLHMPGQYTVSTTSPQKKRQVTISSTAPFRTTTIIYISPKHLDSPPLPVGPASLVVEAPDDDNDLDFVFYNPDGTFARDTLEEELLEFILFARVLQ